MCTHVKIPLLIEIFTYAEFQSFGKYTLSLDDYYGTAGCWNSKLRENADRKAIKAPASYLISAGDTRLNA